MSDKLPVKLHFHHVGIFISNMESSIQWYDEILGFKLAFRRTFDLPGQGPVDMAWIKNGEMYLELYAYNSPQTPFTVKDYLGSLGTKHLCLYVRTEDFEPLKTYWEGKSVNFWVKHRWPEEQVQKPGGCGVVYITDPDGIVIEIQEEFTPGEY
jgi:catechol 2,3-dioxygenase-like lactoylglutathione lyase family enzyme